MFELKPHQEEAVKKLANGHVLVGGTGVGKSHTAVGYYLQNEAPRPVYVITSAKKRDSFDWQDLWMEVGMYRDPKLTMGATVEVDSWENIKKYEEVKDAFFIFDEQRLVGSGRWVKAFYKIASANRWIMLSATPGDNWLDYVPLFRANGFVKNLTQFKEDHVVARWTGRYYQVIGYRQQNRLERWRKQLLVEMPYDKHTTRHTHYVDVQYNKDLVRELVKNRWHVYAQRPLTDASELFRVMRRVVYTDSSRLDAVQSLLTTHPKLIVFYNFNYELEMLRTLSPNSESVTPGGANSKETGFTNRPSSDPGVVRTTTDRWGNEHSLTISGPAVSKGLLLRTTDEQECPTQSAEQQDSPKRPERLAQTSKSMKSAGRSSTGSNDSSTTHPPPSATSSSDSRGSFAVAEWNGHKHEPIPETDSWVYLVQYVAGAEAWECTDTDAMVFYSMPYSYKLWWQSHGRIDRLNTSFLDLHYYVLFGDSILERGVKGSLAEKKSFNEAAFTEFVGIWQK